MRSMYQLAPIAVATLVASNAHGQSLCDLIPAATVKTTLTLTGNLTATPNREGGNGCDYKLDGALAIAVTADSSDASGMVGMMFDRRLKQLPTGALLVPHIGDAAYYVAKPGQNIAKDHTNTYTQQSLVFRAKGKVVSFIVMTPGSGVPKDALLTLGTLTASKPIDSLKDSK